MEIAIIFLPLFGAILSGFFGNRLGNKFSQVTTSLLVSLSSVLSFIIFYKVITENYSSVVHLATWINSGTLNVNWAIKIDALSSIMLVVVCLISSLIHIYSIGYMSHDPHKPRFMSYLSLFTFSMLILVTSDNFLQLFFGWEGVGLCSYFLIGFWYKKPSANAAAIKAFIVNRVGDVGLAIGIFLIFYLLFVSFIYFCGKNIINTKQISISPLQVKVVTKSGKIYSAIAINEISLLRQSRQTASLQITNKNKILIKKLVCDGVLVSTPAGSTAYNLSVSGPILSLNSKKLAVTAISPFRPRRWKGKIVSSSSIIKIKNLNIEKRSVSAVADNFEVRNIKSIIIKNNSNIKFTLLYDKDNSLTKKIKLEQYRTKR